MQLSSGLEEQPDVECNNPLAGHQGVNDCEKYFPIQEGMQLVARWIGAKTLQPQLPLIH